MNAMEMKRARAERTGIVGVRSCFMDIHTNGDGRLKGDLESWAFFF